MPVQISDKYRGNNQSQDDRGQRRADGTRRNVINQAKEGKQLEARMEELSKKIDHWAILFSFFLETDSMSCR